MESRLQPQVKTVQQEQPSEPVLEQPTSQKQEIKRGKRKNVRRGQNPNKVQPQPQSVQTKSQTTTPTNQGFIGSLRNK